MTHDSLALPGEDRISILGIGSAVLRHWRIVVAVPLLLAIAVAVWSLTRERMYEATASFMPQVAESRGGGAAALAQQFGINLGAERGSQSPQFYVDILRSTTLLREAVESTYQLAREEEQWNGTLIQYWDMDARRDPLPPWRRAVDHLRDNLTPAVNRETGIVRFMIATDHPLLSEKIAERLLELLNEFNLEVRRSRAEEEARFIRGRMEEAQAELLTAERTLEEFLRTNRQFRNSPELVFENDRLTRNVLMRQNVYTSLLQSEEQARIDAVRDTRMLTVIDNPAGTARPQRRGTAVRTLLAVVIGFLMAVFLAVVVEMIRYGRTAPDPEYAEFHGLARQAWHDLKHPERWLGSGGRTVANRDR